MKTSEEMTRDVLARIRAETAQKARRRKRAGRALAAGGVLCLAALAVICLPRQERTQPEKTQRSPASVATETEPTPETTAPADETQTAQAKSSVRASESETQTRQFAAESSSSGMNNLPFIGPEDETMAADKLPYLIRDAQNAGPAKYPCPQPGEHIVTLPLSEAVAAHAGDERANYFLRFEVMNDALDTMTPEAQAAFYLAEAERMDAADAGDQIDFSVETATDAGTGETHVVFAGYLRDPSFLDAFPDSPDYGYFIALHDEASSVK